MEITEQLNEIKKRIVKNQKVKAKDGHEYKPYALRLVYTTANGWIYSVECIEEKTNSVIHIKLSDIELQEGCWL